MPQFSDEEIQTLLNQALAPKNNILGVEGENPEPEGAGRFGFPLDSFPTSMRTHMSPFSPNQIYLIYISQSNGELTAMRCQKDCDVHSVDAVEKKMIADIRALDFSGMTILGGNLSKTMFKRKAAAPASAEHCYVTVFVDSDIWTLAWSASNQICLIEFRDVKSVHSASNRFDPNFALWNPKRLGKREYWRGNGVRYENHRTMKNASGNIVDIPSNIEQQYSMDIYVKTPVHDAQPGNPPNHYYLVIDPDGENEGPK